jgi:hypothetical protein
MKIIVAGYMIRYPLAGMMMAFFHYLLGLSRLGHRIIYVEESGWPDACYDPWTGGYSNDPSAGLNALMRLAERFGLDSTTFCYVDRETGETSGISMGNLRGHLASADLLLNIGGTCSLPEFELCRRRALIDMDPVFTQAGRFGGRDLSEYDAHFSYGANIGFPECSVPDAGLHWYPTIPPVVPELWSDQADQPAESASLTTVCNWSAYGAIEYAGEHYGQKDEEFMRLGDMPRRSRELLELALSGADAAVQAKLREWGWKLRDATEVTIDFDAYADYIDRSRAEFSVAKHAYVRTQSGWFSDRSVCYLASGRPVVLQDTGIGRWLPASPAVLTFSTPEQALECLESMRSDYRLRCRSARDLANDLFGSEVVLPKLLETAFSSVSVPARADSAAGLSTENEI